MSGATTIPSIDLDIKSVDHMGVKLFVFMERRDDGKPRFLRIIAPPPDKTPDGFGAAARDYMENVVGLASTLAIELLHEAVKFQRETAAREEMQSEHINANGEFQSDKYPWCKPGFVPMKLTDKMAQSLLWDYSVRREDVDKQFSEDLRTCLMNAGCVGLLPPAKGGA